MSRPADPAELRAYRNSKLYRSLIRILRVYNRYLVAELHARGFEDFTAAFPPLLANLDTEGTRIGVLAVRAGVSRQAAGQLLAEIEAAGYVSLKPDPGDRRATIVAFTAKGQRMLANVFELVEQFDGQLATIVSERELERVQTTLATLADRIDPDGALGTGDRSEVGRPGRAGRRT